MSRLSIHFSINTHIKESNNIRLYRKSFVSKVWTGWTDAKKENK